MRIWHKFANYTPHGDEGKTPEMITKNDIYTELICL